MTTNAGDPRPTPEELEQLREGLCRALPELAPRYLYDDVGSALFERITELPEYYPTRTEIGILEREAQEIVDDAAARHLVELGSGAGRKIRALLERWRERDRGGRCTLFDVNATFLDASLATLRAAYPLGTFDGFVGDFTRDLATLDPKALDAAHSPRLTVFFAGTIGNFTPDERHAFFAHFGRTLGLRDSLLVGVDLVKDFARLEAAYNDSQGVTAEFNLNALRVVNARFGADFQVDAFEHRAFFDPQEEWIEMRLRATRPTRAHVRAIDLDLSFAPGDEIRTEISCKFTRWSLGHAVERAGLTVRSWHTDPEGLFALAHLWRSP